MGRFGVLAGRSSRCRLLVVLVAVLTMVSSLGAVSSAQAAVVKQSLSLSPPSMAKTAALASRGVAAVAAASRAVARAPQILLTPSTAIGAETVKVTGRLPKAKSRPVTVQRKSGKRWVTMVKTRTTGTGSYAKTFRAAKPGSYTIRTLAPRVKVSGRVRAQYVTSTRTLRVVAQTASLSMPATWVEDQTATATLTFSPVRAGRAVALQIWQSGAWVEEATGKQSATGTASLTMTAGTPASYTYRAWTAARAGAPPFASPNRTLKVTAAPDIPVPDTTAPGTVADSSATPVSTTSIALAWTNPTDADFTGVTIRRAVGDIAPASATSGTGVTNTDKAATSFTDTGLADTTQYSYALFAHDGAANHAAAESVTATTKATGSGEISGTVTEAAYGHHGLKWVQVRAFSASTGAKASAYSAANGTYTVIGLPAATDYQVCFSAWYTEGGSPDATTGYAGQCWQNQPWTATEAPTLVAVTLGATSTGINAALVAAGAISGTVIDAGGTQHGLQHVFVQVRSASGGYMGDAWTAADGSYKVISLWSDTDDYSVCFSTSDAKGGSTDASGYVDQCWQNQPNDPYGTPTPVAVTLGVTTTINASLVPGAAISGTVTDAAGHRLANVGVSVTIPSERSMTSLSADADGNWSIRGLAAGTDLKVCFSGASATGGSSDADGYEDQCWQNKPNEKTSTPVAVTSGVTTTGINAALVGGGRITGTVTDAAGTHHGLAYVQVRSYSPSTGTYGNAMTDADGSYTLKGLPAATDHTVFFDPFQQAAGGSSDESGYFGEYWQNQPQYWTNQPASGTPTPVSVTSGATTTGINAALSAASVISGTVTDAAGTHHGLSNVYVTVYSPSARASAIAWTAADGSYSVEVPAGTDYQVCFTDYGQATGGSSDATGYLSQCWQNQPASGTPTPVAVTAASIKAGINAALGAAPAILGATTNAGLTGEGLADVRVRMSSQSTGETGSPPPPPMGAATPPPTAVTSMTASWPGRSTRPALPAVADGYPEYHRAGQQ